MWFKFLSYVKNGIYNARIDKRKKILISNYKAFSLFDC